MAPGEIPSAGELIQSAEASTRPLISEKLTNGDAINYGVGNGWRSWSTGEKGGIVGSAVVVAVGIMVAWGAAIFIIRKRRIRKQKKKEKDLLKKGGNRGKGTKGGGEKRTREPPGIEMMETVSNGPTALTSNPGDSMAVTRQETSSLAAEPLMMSGALQENQKVRKERRPFLPTIMERRTKH